MERIDCPASHLKKIKMGKVWAIALHGGAGIDPNLPLEYQKQAQEVLTRCLLLGVDALRRSLPAVDVVELVVRELETDPTFNAGKGGALASDGTVELEASIMNGDGRRCGAVSGVKMVKNPISLARLVMDRSPHSYLAFDGAQIFATQQGVELVDNSYFVTQENVDLLSSAKQVNEILLDYKVPTSKDGGISSSSSGFPKMNGLPLSVYLPETVGCVAVDVAGNCASATSTGGLVNKKIGRIGDSPIIGAGTYACKVCAVSCTGEGEAIIRGTLARDVAAVMEYEKANVKKAAEHVIGNRLDGGRAGLIAVSSDGEVGCAFNTNGMFRAWATEDGPVEVAIW